jgi:pimeloyl-ACP methyl ester carboxylesterase
MSVGVADARGPGRMRQVNANGLRISVYEWGDRRDPPLLAAHGGGDFSRTFDLLAPRLARAGWRVVAWDQRGHGASQHAALYSWRADVRDALAILDDLGGGPVPIVGHSKGGVVVTALAASCRRRVSGVVNIDGFPSHEHFRACLDGTFLRDRVQHLPEWLAEQAGAAALDGRPLDALVRRRRELNRRLPRWWIDYQVRLSAHGDERGWRWCADPARLGAGFFPLDPIQYLRDMAGLTVPALAVVAGVAEPALGTGTRVEEIAPYLPRKGFARIFRHSGHFVHVEQPAALASLIIDFFSSSGWENGIAPRVACASEEQRVADHTRGA